MIKTCYYLPPELIQRIKAEYQRTGARQSEVVRRALDEYLAKREQQEWLITSTNEPANR